MHTNFEINGSFLTAYEVVLSGFYSSIGVFKHQDFSNQEHEKALEVLEYLEISQIKDKKVHQMSTGQLRRCIIGRALIHNPKAFILDEPTANIDEGTDNVLLQLMKENEAFTEATVFIIAHRLSTIEHSDMILVMSEGKIIEQDIASNLNLFTIPN